MNQGSHDLGGSASRGKGSAYRGRGSACLHFIQGGLHLREGVCIKGEVCIQGEGGLHSGEGSASRGLPASRGGGCADPLSPLEPGKWAVRILLECFLVLLSSTLNLFNKSITSNYRQI